MTRYLLLTCFCILSLFSVAQKNQDAILINLEKARFEAMLNKDSVFLKRILSDDLVYVHSNGGIDSKNSFIRSITSGDLVYYSIETTAMNARIIGKLGLINGMARIKVKPPGASSIVDLSISYLDVYYNRNNRWQLEAWQSAKLNP